MIFFSVFFSVFALVCSLFAFMLALGAARQMIKLKAEHIKIEKQIQTLIIYVGRFHDSRREVRSAEEADRGIVQ